MDFDRDVNDNVDHIHCEDDEMEEQYVSNIDMTGLYVRPNTGLSEDLGYIVYAFVAVFRPPVFY